jgi:hypothetical protein
VAHILAKLCFELNSDFMWNGDPPNLDLIDVMNDVPLFENKMHPLLKKRIQASKYSAPHIMYFNNLAWLVKYHKV